MNCNNLSINKLFLIFQAYWKATHPPVRSTPMQRTLQPSQEASPSVDATNRMGTTPPGKFIFH